MRNGNFSYSTPFSGEGFIVHRGVSQGGKKLTPKKRREFWQKNCQKIEGAVVLPDRVTFSLSGIRILRKKDLVLASNPEKPQVWTPKRLMKAAKKKKVEEGIPQGASTPRRGKLIL